MRFSIIASLLPLTAIAQSQECYDYPGWHAAGKFYLYSFWCTIVWFKCILFKNKNEKMARNIHVHGTQVSLNASLMY